MRWKKITIFFLATAIAVPALFVPTKRVHAVVSCIPFAPPPTPLGLFVPSYDAAVALQVSYGNLQQSSQTTKECILDGLVTFLKEALINEITGSIVDWINSDFEGGPAFVTDPAGFFTNIADITAGNFIETQLGGIGQLLCSPFDLRLRLNLWLSTGSSRKQYIGCRLTDIQKNAYGAFTGGGFIANGGWNTFHALTSDPRNNQFGAYILASDALNTELMRKTNEKLRELSEGRGFLSYKKCTDWSEGPNEGTGEGSAKVCLKYKVETPGSLINGQLNNVFGSELRKFEVADEINEVFQALVNYGLRQVFSSARGGLRGASKASVTVTGESFVTVQDRIQRQGNQGDDALLNTAGTNAIDPTRQEINKRVGSAGAGGVTSLSEIKTGNIALGKEAAQLDNCDRLGAITVQDPFAQAAVNNQKAVGSIYYGSFACTSGNYWRVDLETDATSKIQGWVVDEINEIVIYRLTGDWKTVGTWGTYVNTLNQGKFKVEILGADPLTVLFAKEYNASDFTGDTLSIKTTNIKRGRYVRIVDIGDVHPLAIAEVEVFGKATQGNAASMVPQSGVTAEPPPITSATTGTGGNTTPTLTASVNVEVKTDAAAFTINEPLSNARIGVMITKKENGVFKDFAPSQEFSKILVRVKNETTGEIKLEEEFVNNEPRFYKTTKTFNVVAGERIAVGYEFTPTSATRGETYGLITEITDTAGIQISGAVSTINIQVP